MKRIEPTDATADESVLQGPIVIPRAQRTKLENGFAVLITIGSAIDLLPALRHRAPLTDRRVAGAMFSRAPARNLAGNCAVRINR
jgi:hypothetical protein